MKNIVIKISSIILAFSVLFSTFSFTVEKHYCGDFLVDVSYVGQADGCGMEKSSSIHEFKKKCCRDEVHKIDGQDKLQNSNSATLNLKGQYAINSFLYNEKDLVLEEESKKILLIDFSPPDTSKDYQVSHQIFLI